MPVGGKLVFTANPGTGTTLRSPLPTVTMRARRREDTLAASAPTVFIPAGMPGLQGWLKDQPIQLVVQGPGGIGVEQGLTAALRTEIPGSYALTTRAFANYVQVEAIVVGLRAIIIAVASVGLMSFLLAGIDQVLARRATMAGLLALGVPRGTLRRAQLWEALVPLGLGIPATVALGRVSGATLLQITTRNVTAGLGDTIGLATGCVAGVAVIATVLLTMSVPRIDPEALRRP